RSRRNVQHFLIIRQSSIRAVRGIFAPGTRTPSLRAKARRPPLRGKATPPRSERESRSQPSGLSFGTGFADAPQEKASIPETNPDRLRRLHHLSLRFDDAELVDGLLDRHGVHVIGLVADHAAEAAFFGQLHGHHAEAGAENPVERRRRAAALEVAERAGAGFLAGQLFEAAGDDFADA